MNVMEELRGNYDEAEKLWSAYEDKLKNFRSNIKNDVASLEASARKTTEAVQRMNKAYSDVVVQMNGPEMQQAIANAERLATAMTALAGLQSHMLTVTVIDNARATDPSTGRSP